MSTIARSSHNHLALAYFPLTAQGVLYTVYKIFIVAVKYRYIHIVLLKTCVSGWSGSVTVRSTVCIEPLAI